MNGDLTKLRDANSDELRIAGSVVTLADLNGRLGGVRRLVVRPKAVVTPSARDELRERRIDLVFEAVPTAKKQNGDAVSAVSSATPKDLTIIAARTRTSPQEIASAIKSTDLRIDCRSTDCLIETSDRTAESASKVNAVVVIVTAHTAAALCLANRKQGVRAVLVSDADEFLRDADAVGANVIVVSPKKFPFYQLKRIVERFASCDARKCPPVFRDRLN